MAHGQIHAYADGLAGISDKVNERLRQFQSTGICLIRLIHIIQSSDVDDIRVLLRRSDCIDSLVDSFGDILYGGLRCNNRITSAVQNWIIVFI